MAKKRKTSSKPPKAAAAKPAPITEPRKASDSLTDDQLQALLFQHKRKIKEINGRIDELTRSRKEAYALAKAEGVARKDIDIAIELEDDAGIVKYGDELKRIERLARWMGVALGTQASLFDADHFADGKRAAMSDEPRKPPKQLSQKDAQRWMDGHDEGRTALNETRARQFAPIGDQPPTVQ